MNTNFQKMKALDYYLILLSSVILLGINACKPKKEIIRATLHTTEKAENELFSDILSNQLDFSTFSAKLNISLSNAKHAMASKANLKIINDQILQLSVQPLFGIEIFRFYIDNDTVVILDRMNKRYVKESINELKNRYPVEFDYHTLQSLFTNKLFLGANKVLTPSDYTQFTYGKTTTNYYLKSINNDSSITYLFTIDGDDRITFSHLFHPTNKYSLQWSYSDFKQLGICIFPYKGRIEVNSPKHKLDIEMNYTDIVLNEPMELSITIPKGYTQTNFSDIIKIITADSR